MSQIILKLLQSNIAWIDDVDQNSDTRLVTMKEISERLTRATEQRNEAVTGGAFKAIYHECGNCGVPRFEHGGIIEKCPNCGDDEIDLSLIGDVP